MEEPSAVEWLPRGLSTLLARCFRSGSSMSLKCYEHALWQTKDMLAMGSSPGTINTSEGVILEQAQQEDVERRVDAVGVGLDCGDRDIRAFPCAEDSRSRHPCEYSARNSEPKLTYEDAVAPAVRTAPFGELADVAAIDTTALVTHTSTIQAAALPMTAVDAAAGGGLTLRAARYTAVNLAFAEISVAARTQRRGTRA